ncbi:MULTISPECIES: SDR family NAD(P)-dependent oxidoreductase [unclassified Helicobacter]|uniref:SDR family NAD(P)-dependent oxidoreductase n=1 Tax=unclassified Helicobacter TaxID=2593540 RepID=UPI000CF101A0|nr:MULTISPECIES: SDR family NAD(P)-dependent oxidoreductase [unclassified Helicobacter]
MLILITGASCGFGEAIAKRFVQENHEVILIARRKEKLKNLQKTLGNKCKKIIASDVNDMDTIKKELEEELNNIDILVNNAGLALGIESAENCEISDWEKMIETNILGLVKVTHFVLPSMVKKHQGHIINIGSIAGTYPYEGGNIYGATKAFVKQFSLNLRADLVGKNIRITNIEPGLCEGSEFSIVRFKGDVKKARELYENANALTPEDIAESVYWCAMLPPHVNINRLEIMPTTQASAGLKVHKTIR